MTRSAQISRDVASPDDVNGGPPLAPPADDDAGHAVRPGRLAIARSARIGRTGRPVTILFLSGHAREHGRLALDEEYRAIEQRIRAARHRDAFQLIPKLAVR